MKKLKTLCTLKNIILGLAVFMIPSALLAAPSPVGYWITIADRSVPRGIVHIYKDKYGGLAGRVLGGFTKEGVTPHANCTHCSARTYDPRTGYGLMQNHPIIGGVIMWGYKKQANHWVNGVIVDTTTGKHYDSSISLYNTGTLAVVGRVMMFSKTQYWKRVNGLAGIKKLCQPGSTPGYTVTCAKQYR